MLGWRAGASNPWASQSWKSLHFKQRHYRGMFTAELAFRRFEPDLYILPSIITMPAVTLPGAPKEVWTSEEGPMARETAMVR
jgi:hypothetical protein